MKTSDRILLTFFLLIFLTAFASMVALKQKVNSKEFTVIEWMGKTEPKTKTTPLPDITTDRPVRVVRVVGPGPGLLDCKIIPSDSPRIQYRTIKLQQDHFPRDSVRVKQIADTLIIEYAGPIRPGENFVEYRVDVDLWLPSWDKLEIDGADVQLGAEGQEVAGRDIIIRNKGKLTTENGFTGKLNVEYR